MAHREAAGPTSPARMGALPTRRPGLLTPWRALTAASHPAATVRRSVAAGGEEPSGVGVAGGTMTKGHAVGSASSTASLALAGCEYWILAGMM